MKQILALFLAAVALIAFVPAAPAAAPAKIILIAGKKSHGPGDHEYEQGALLLKHCLDTSPNVKGVRVEVVRDGWPTDERVLEDAATILLFSDGSDRDEQAHPLLHGARLQTLDRLMKRGCGFLAVHYAVFIPAKKGGEQYLDWMGGYFDYESGPPPRNWFSKIETKNYRVAPATPAHPIARGLQPFEVREEYYFNMKFRAADARLAPILSFGTDPQALPSTVAWAVERQDGGRGFGYTGGHFHKNWENENARRLVLNALLWTAKVEVPPGGVQSTLPIAAAPPTAKALIITGNNHPAHHWRETTPALKEILAPAGVLADVTEDPESLAQTDLSGYALLVMNYVNWERPGLSDAAKAKFLGHLQRGGGLALIHFADGAFHPSLPRTKTEDAWPEFHTKICRRVWDHAAGKSGHDAFGPFRVEVTTAKHPITDGLASFDTTDELYFRQQGEAPIEALAVARSKVTGQDEPMAFAYDYGKARVFQTLLGHDAAAIRKASELIRRGSAWAAGLPLAKASNQAPPPLVSASVVNAPAVPRPKFGLAFDARTGHLEAAFQAAYQTPPLTVECWAKLGRATSYNLLVVNGPKDSGTHWELFSMAGTGAFMVYVPGFAPDHVRSAKVITDGLWHHLAMVHEGERIRLYVDAQEVVSTAVTRNAKPSAPGPLWFGAYPPGATGCDGLVDDVRISRGVRAIARVPEAAFTADETTLGLWSFDVVTPAGFADASALKNFAAVKALAAQPSPASAPAPLPASNLAYVKAATREATEQATLAAMREKFAPYKVQPWQALGSAEAKFAADGATDLKADYTTNGNTLKWAAVLQFADGQWRKFETTNGWLYRVIEAEQEQEVTLIFSARRPLTVRLNGAVLPGELGPPGWLATQIAYINEKVPFYVRLKRGANHLSVRVSEPTDFFFDITPLSGAQRKELNARLDQDFPGAGEASFYKLETITPPPHVVLEVGGMCFVPDGTLAVCTRRGEIWLGNGAPVSDPARTASVAQRAGSESGAPLVWRLFASGLQEPLGIWANKPGEFFVVQRSELTRIVDTDGDGRADVFETITAEPGVSASQHAYIFGPVRDSKGNFWGAISGIGVSGAGKYFGWSFKVTPKGEFIPWSSGLRSPNGLVLTPDDELFITDNQGEYMGTCPLHHVSKGAFHGHVQGLKWDTNFPAGDKTPHDEMAARRKLPAIVFPYGTMGQSLGQPLVDTTGGKFGPFAGQMLVPDVTKCNVLRVALEKVDGEFQGACFPFRSGFQAGNNRLAFAPDGSLYVGQTDRGWGSIGGRDHGLQRLVWTGRVPLEAKTVKLTRDGFEVIFTQPLDAASASAVEHWSLQHFFYLYRAAYGSPQMENTPVPVKEAKLSADRKTVRLTLGELSTGKVYELRFDKLRGADGAEPLHAVAYYTLNRRVKE